MADWAGLIEDLLRNIVEKLIYFDDITVYRAVCKAWRSSYTTNPPLPPKFPWLMLAEDDVGDRGGIATTTEVKDVLETRRLFNVSNSKVYELKLPEACGRRCFGVNFGWLVTLGLDLQINLLHPLTRQQIPLPPQPTCPHQTGNNYVHTNEKIRELFISKVALSSNPWDRKRQTPAGNDCIIMVICGIGPERLGFARLGDKYWTHVDGLPSGAYADIVFYQGQFYTVNWGGNVYVCHIGKGNDTRASQVAPAPEGYIAFMRQPYLVECCGDLLLVARFRDEQYDTRGFQIWKLAKSYQEEGNYKYSWVEVKSLGINALLLGMNSSVSLSISDDHQVNLRYKPNHIYFTDDDNEGFHDDDHLRYDTGVFNLDTTSIHFLGATQHLSYSTPLWHT